MRHVMGIAVFSGMLGVTLFGLLLTGVILIQSLICECVRLCHERNIPVPLFQSQNTERKTNNEALFDRYASRIPRF